MGAFSRLHVDGARPEKRWPRTINAREEMATCATLDALTQLGKRRGYRYPEAWARKVFEARKKRK